MAQGFPAYLSVLRIRRLGVRVPPGVPLKPMHGKAYRMTELLRPSDVWEPFAGAVVIVLEAELVAT